MAEPVSLKTVWVLDLEDDPEPVIVVLADTDCDDKNPNISTKNAAEPVEPSLSVKLEESSKQCRQSDDSPAVSTDDSPVPYPVLCHKADGQVVFSLCGGDMSSQMYPKLGSQELEEDSSASLLCSDRQSQNGLKTVPATVCTKARQRSGQSENVSSGDKITDSPNPKKVRLDGAVLGDLKNTMNSQILEQTSKPCVDVSYSQNKKKARRKCRKVRYTVPRDKSENRRRSCRSSEDVFELEDLDQATLLAYFNSLRMNRTSMRRMTTTERRKELESQALKKLKDGCEDGLKVMNVEGKGRAVFANKTFDRNEFVVEYSGELIDMNTAKQREILYAQDDKVGCYMFYFSHNKKQHCIDATTETGRLGRLLNHSRKGNCYTKVIVVDDVPRLVLLALRQINQGEELTYDYGDRSATAVVNHPWLKD